MGFVFGSSKKGNEVRETIDGMLTELTSSDAMKALDDKKNELSEMACNTISKITGKLSDRENSDDGSDDREDGDSDELEMRDSEKVQSKKPKSEEQSFEPEQESDSESKADSKSETGKAASPKALDVDKAQELADKLGAKPSAPEDENLAAYSHHDDELKSA